MAAVKRIEAENARREEEEAGESIRARPIVETAVFHHSAVSVLKEHVPEASVDAIITHPQAMTEALPLLSGLADFAAHALKRGGVLVVMADALLLPQMIEHLKHDKVRWLCEFDLWYDRPGRERYPLRVRFHRTPLLIYGKSRFQLDGGDDVIRVPDLDKAARGPGRQHPAELAMSLIVRRFARRGQVVCDPFVLGRGGAAVGAMRHGCNFIGADQDSSCIDRTQSILARAEAEFLS